MLRRIELEVFTTVDRGHTISELSTTGSRSRMGFKSLAADYKVRLPETKLRCQPLVEKGEINKLTSSYSITQRGRREIRGRREWENECVDFDEETAEPVESE